MQEVESPAIPIAPETAADPAPETEPAPEGAESAATPADAPVAEPEGEPEEAPPSFDYETWKDNETFKPWYEEQLEEARWTAQVQAMDKASESIMTAETRKDAVIAAWNAVSQRLEYLEESGKIGNIQEFRTELGRVMATHAPALSDTPKIVAEGILQPAVNQASAVATAQSLALLAGDDKELMEIAGRLVQNTGQYDANRNPIFMPSAEFKVDYGQKALKDFGKRWTKKAEERGYQRGLKDRTAATVEAQKVTQRNGKGPVEVKGSSGGVKTYLQMTPEERAALSPAERDRLAALG